MPSQQNTLSFNSSSLSNGEEFITSAQLEKRMREIWKMRRGEDDTSEEVEGEEEAQEEGQQRDEQGEGALEPSNHLCAGECANGMALGDQLQGQG